MKPSTKMLLLTRQRGENLPYDERGRMSYDNPEMRRGRGRNGRYVSRNEYPMPPTQIGYDRDMEDEYTGPARNRMAYSPYDMAGEDRPYPGKSVRYGNAYDGDIYARGSIVMSPNRKGKTRGDEEDDDDTYYAPIDERTAHKWAKKFRNADGSVGAHWTVEQLEPLRNSLAPTCEKWDLYVAANMMYSDYSKVAQKYGADRPEFYVEMAKAFLCDPDAKDGKLRRYIEFIAE